MKAATPAAPTAPAAKPVAPPKPAPKLAPPVHVPLATRDKIVAKSVKPALTAKEVLAAKARAAAQQAAAKAKAAAASDAPFGATETPAFDAAALDASWADAREHVARAGEAATRLVDVWLERANAAAIAAVSEADDVPGPVRKAARRALFVLKARGIAIPARPDAPKAAPAPTPPPTDATMLPPDGSGTMAFTITMRDPSGRYRIAEVLVSDSAGVVDAGSAWLSGSRIREVRSRAVRHLGVAPTPVSPEWARFRIARALERNAAGGAVLPLGLDGCRGLIEPAPESEPPHPVADLDDAVTSEKAWAVAPGSEALHREPEFRSWMADRAGFEDLLRAAGERLAGEGANDSARVDAILTEELSAATDRYFTPERREAIAARMRDAAVSVRSRSGDEKATEVLAVARAVREAGAVTSPPRDIPFLLAFFRKAIAFSAQQSGGSLRIPVPARA